MDATEGSRIPLLVTTALEQTWGTNEPIVFLGEWCRLYDRRTVWGKRQHSVIRNHWDDRGKLRADYHYLKGLHDTLLAGMVQMMNRCHRIERSLRYWQTILDPWLLTYVAVIWDRWECLRIAFEEHNVLNTVALESDIESKVSYDYNDFIEAVLGDSWNYQLFLDIIKSNYSNRCELKTFPSKPAAGGRITVPAQPTGRSIRHRIVAFIDGLLGRLSTRNQAVIYDAYFSPVALLKLQLSLKQLPRLYLNEFDWPAPSRKAAAPDTRNSQFDRKSFSLDLTPRTHFEKFLLARIVGDIPTIYMEDFSLVHAHANRIPMKPRVILTATAHWGNDLFKHWIAEQQLAGVKVVSIEHGGSILPAFGTMSFEEEIVDIKTTWAVTNHPKHMRLPVSKLTTFKIKSPGKHLAVVGYEMPRYNFRAEASPKSSQMLANHAFVCELYSLLDNDVKNNFLVKPYPAQWGWNTRQRFIDVLGADKVSDERDFHRFLSRVRLIVCTYPQTTFSEAMASGLPSILFYPAQYWETISEMDPLLETLRAAKIAFHDPQAAANHINAIWEDPKQWWDRPEVLHARNEFHRNCLPLDGDWLDPWSTFIKGIAA